RRRQQLQLHFAGQPEPQRSLERQHRAQSVWHRNQESHPGHLPVRYPGADPQWLVNAGLRYDHFETDLATTSANGTTRASDTSEFVTGQLGVVFKPADNGSIYASYATSAIPPGSMLGEGTEENPLATATTRSDMEPEETRNYEIGTKWNLLDDALSLTAAVFRTEKGNARVLVADSTYENAGKTRVNGVELSATGKLTDKWQLFAGYSYLDSELVDGGALGNRSGVVTSPVNPNNGNRLPNTPEHSVTLWTTYDLTSKLKVGGGAFYVDEVFGNVDNTTKVDSYVRYDAMVSYEVNSNLDLQLNVQNLTDEVYYDKAYGTHFANQAPGRTVLLSTNVHFGPTHEKAPHGACRRGLCFGASRDPADTVQPGPAPRCVPHRAARAAAHPPRGPCLPGCRIPVAKPPGRSSRAAGRPGRAADAARSAVPSGPGRTPGPAGPDGRWPASVPVPRRTGCHGRHCVRRTAASGRAAPAPRVRADGRAGRPAPCR